MLLTIPRSLAKQLRSAIRSALRIGPKSLTLPITIKTGKRGLAIRCQNEHAAIQYVANQNSAPGRGGLSELIIPFSMLGEVAGDGDAPVTIRNKNGQVFAEFLKRGEMQRVEHTPPSAEALDAFPACPRKRIRQDGRLMSALAVAAQVTDSDSHRYALRNVCLQGDHGRVVATDGRQLFAQSGYAFPWQGDLLVPVNRHFDAKPWQAHDEVEVGCTKAQFFLAAGPWRLWLPIDLEGRFPRVDDVIPREDQITATVGISDADADFLLTEGKQLPVEDGSTQVVVFDVADEILVWSPVARQSQPKALHLASSTFDGAKIRFCTDRRYLFWALEKGFRRLAVTGADQPLFCRDEDRLYLWATVSGGDAKPVPTDAARISPAVTTPVPASIQSKPSINGRPTLTKNNGTHRNGQTNGRQQPQEAPTAGSGPDLLIEQAEALRTSLRSATKDVGELIAAIKAHRKQTKIVRSTLASLRQLQAIDA